MKYPQSIKTFIVIAAITMIVLLLILDGVIVHVIWFK
jgi:hypothetical protein